MKKLLLIPTLLTVSLLAQTFNVSTTPELRTALATAATNGEDDTIILADGTYKTTDDGGGTFAYFSNEANSLTLQGSSSENVILDGDNTDLIINFNGVGVDSEIYISSISFIKGIGGIQTYESINIDNCQVSHVTNGNPIYFREGKYLKITNSIISNNRNSGSYTSAGLYISSWGNSFEIDNTIFRDNNGTNGAAINIYNVNVLNITNSVFENNIATGSGGAIYTTNSASLSIHSTHFLNNTANSGGGIGVNTGYHKLNVLKNITAINNTSRVQGSFYYGEDLYIENSIFNGNNSTDSNGTVVCTNGGAPIILNSLFSGNNGAIVVNDSNAKIVNTIFLDNTIYDVAGERDDSAVMLYNNYINPSLVSISIHFDYDNIFDGVNLGFVDAANGDYNLTASSDLIDAGTTAIVGITLPETDLSGNARIVGGTIDIGPYEFSTTRPTINAITHSGIAKEQTALTFSTDYTLASGRAIDTVEYDFTNSGSWSTASTHTFNTAGTYTVKVKVTDSEGEFSTTSKVVTVAALVFSEMTSEQKLVKAIDPLYYDAIVAIIEEEKTASSTSGRELGLYEGKEYVQNNLAEFGLVSKTDVDLAPSKISSLGSGWTLTSTPFEITDLSVFDAVSAVWVYNNSTATWSAYSSNATTRQKIIDSPTVNLLTTIPAGSGVWVQK